MQFKETKELTSVYKDMVLQFPMCELKSYDTLFALLQKPNYRLFLCEENSKEVGYVFVFEAEEFILLDYFAIFKEFQGEGFGSQILTELKKYFVNKKGCFMEVEKPNPQIKNTLRRINFYKKNGAQKLDLEYFYPSKEGALPLDLYFVGYSKPKNSEIKEFINELFEEIHNDIKNIQEIKLEIFNSLEIREVCA